MLSVIARVVERYKKAHSVRVVVDLQATLAARKKYPLFDRLVIAAFDQSVSLYRIFDGEELKHILSTGKITGGSYSVKAEREHGASWGMNISEVITWGNGQRGKRLGSDLFLAKLDAFDKKFAHLDPNIEVDVDGPDEQPAVIDWKTCNTGVGCSVIDVTVNDVDFFTVDEDGRMHRATAADLKAALKKQPAEPAKPNEKVRDPSWGLQPKDKVVVTKGSKGLGIEIRNYGSVRDVWQDPGSKEVRVQIQLTYPRKLPSGSWVRDPFTLFATHPNRLSDPEIALLDSRGNRILVRKR